MRQLYLFTLLVFLTAGCSHRPLQSPHYDTFKDPVTKLYGITKNGEVLLPARYDHIFTTNHVLFDVIENGTLKRINEKGELVFTPYPFDNGPDYYVQGLSRFVLNTRIGFHDEEGRIVIKPKYDWAAPFPDPDMAHPPELKPYAAVCMGCAPERAIKNSACNHTRITGGKWGLIDKKGNEVVPLKYATYEKAVQALKNKLN